MTREILGDGEPSAEAAPALASSPAYPLRALVRADAWDFPGARRGSLIQVREVDTREWESFDPKSPSQPFPWFAEDLILDPTDEQIADERAKLGAPFQDAEGVPERSEGSPSPAAPAHALGEGSPSPYEAMREVRTNLHARGLTETQIDDVMDVIITLGWRPAALSRAGER
jgi:hypothetical protein